MNPDSGATIHCGACSQGQQLTPDRSECECPCHPRYWMDGRWYRPVPENIAASWADPLQFDGVDSDG